MPSFLKRPESFVDFVEKAILFGSVIALAPSAILGIIAVLAVLITTLETVVYIYLGSLASYLAFQAVLYGFYLYLGYLPAALLRPAEPEQLFGPVPANNPNNNNNNNG